MEPLLLIGAAVVAYLYLSGSSSGSGSSGSTTVQSSGPGQFGLPATGNAATTNTTSWRAASPVTSFAPGQISAGYFGGGGHAEQAGSGSGGYRAPVVSDSPMPDMTHYYDKPQAIDTNPVYNPAVQPAMTQEQIDFMNRCTYIDGNWKPGCK